jgi:1,4-dihydroxy-2-naphthoyl-CoA hydrolase
MTDTEVGMDYPYEGLIVRLGITVESIAPDRTVASMEVEGNTQPYGYLHGGASAALAETVGSLAAMAHAGRGKMAVGVDLNITHHRSVRSGTVTAIATAAHLGRTVATYDVAIVSADQKRIATARLTCFIRSAS